MRWQLYWALVAAALQGGKLETSGWCPGRAGLSTEGGLWRSVPSQPMACALSAGKPASPLPAAAFPHFYIGDVVSEFHCLGFAVLCVWFFFVIFYLFIFFREHLTFFAS